MKARVRAPARRGYLFAITILGWRVLRFWAWALWADDDLHFFFLVCIGGGDGNGSDGGSDGSTRLRNAIVVRCERVHATRNETKTHIRKICGAASIRTVAHQIARWLMIHKSHRTLCLCSNSCFFFRLRISGNCVLIWIKCILMMIASLRICDAFVMFEIKLKEMRFGSGQFRFWNRDFPSKIRFMQIHNRKFFSPTKLNWFGIFNLAVADQRLNSKCQQRTSQSNAWKSPQGANAECSPRQNAVSNFQSTNTISV